jgi:hypothetical protein
MVSVVLVENGLQSVGEGVGGTDGSLGKPLVKPISGQKSAEIAPRRSPVESG